MAAVEDASSAAAAGNKEAATNGSKISGRAASIADSTGMLARTASTRGKGGAEEEVESDSSDMFDCAEDDDEDVADSSDIFDCA